MTKCRRIRGQAHDLGRDPGQDRVVLADLDLDPDQRSQDREARADLGPDLGRGRSLRPRIDRGRGQGQPRRTRTARGRAQQLRDGATHRTKFERGREFERKVMISELC